MRLSSLFIAIGLSLAAQASSFGGSKDSPLNYKFICDTKVCTTTRDYDSPPDSTWSKAERLLPLLKRVVPPPKHIPTRAELRDLIEALADIRDSTFGEWDQITLRRFLLELGVITPPKSRKKELIPLAKEKYKAYTDAAIFFSARTRAAGDGDSTYRMTKSASSLVSKATAAGAHTKKDAVRRFDESKDYVYSTWDEAQMRKYLESKGHAELLEIMHGGYGRVTTPIWKAWSDSYIVGCIFCLLLYANALLLQHHWLVSHNIIESTLQKDREYYFGLMEKYYYDHLDTVWSTWSDSQLKQWLVEHDVIKSDTQVTRDKMTKMIQFVISFPFSIGGSLVRFNRDNYYSAKDTFWHAWSDNQVRDYLVENGYIPSDAQVWRERLYKLADDKYVRPYHCVDN